jgi:hypothetical protein
MMESMDDLLAQLKAEYEEKDNPKKPKVQQSLPEQPRQQTPVAPTPQTPVLQTTNFKLGHEDNLLAELKAEFEAQEQEAELKKQQQLQEEQRRQEQIKQQQRQALTQEAQAWLKKLNPRSEEGLWFEEFSYEYSSKLEAAIDYLQALKEVKP